MPRPKVKGKVCNLPQIDLFGPLVSNPNKREVIYLNIEEYESIRIIDFVGKSQEECASEMAIARTTLQRIYYSAKQKIADALIHGKILKIQGGNFRLCNKDIECFKCKHCPYRTANC